MKLAARRLAGAVALSLALGAGAAGASVTEILRRTDWGESADALASTFDARATVLETPIEYGDSEVRVVLPAEEIGGHRFAVYFQADKDTGGLKRIHFERPRHGAVLGIYRDVVAALESEYGAPARSCDLPRGATRARQAAHIRIWRTGDTVIRAVFRDTTLQASEGCFPGTRSGTSPCGLAAQLFVQAGPDEAVPDACG